MTHLLAFLAGMATGAALTLWRLTSSYARPERARMWPPRQPRVARGRPDCVRRAAHRKVAGYREL